MAPGEKRSCSANAFATSIGWLEIFLPALRRGRAGNTGLLGAHSQIH
jgi:hypothetical protein